MVFQRNFTGGTFSNPDDIRPATTTHQGLMSKTDKAILDALNTALGVGSETVPGANVAVAATTITTLASVTLTAGTYILYGWANILMGAGAGVADLYLRDGVTQLAGTVATFTIAAAGQAGGVTPLYRVVTSGSTFNLACFATAACTGRALGGGAGGFNNMMGIRAVELR